MIHVQSAGGLVRNSQNKYVIINQWGNSWCYPKGHVEDGEDFQQAAKREVFEETGLSDLKLIKYLGEVVRAGGESSEKIKHIHIYLFETDSDDLKSEGVESQAKWVDFEEFISLLTYKEDKDFFSNLKDKEKI